MNDQKTNSIISEWAGAAKSEDPGELAQLRNKAAAHGQAIRRLQGASMDVSNAVRDAEAATAALFVSIDRGDGEQLEQGRRALLAALHPLRDACAEDEAAQD